MTTVSGTAAAVCFILAYSNAKILLDHLSFIEPRTDRTLIVQKGTQHSQEENESRMYHALEENKTSMNRTTEVSGPRMYHSLEKSKPQMHRALEKNKPSMNRIMEVSGPRVYRSLEENEPRVYLEEIKTQLEEIKTQLVRVIKYYRAAKPEVTLVMCFSQYAGITGEGRAMKAEKAEKSEPSFKMAVRRMVHAVMETVMELTPEPISNFIEKARDLWDSSRDMYKTIREDEMGDCSMDYISKRFWWWLGI